MPDETMGNIAKLNTNDGFWEVMVLAGDIAGGVVATMPSEKDLENPETMEYVAKYLKAAAPAKERMRMARFLQNWVAGLHGVSTYQGSGPNQSEYVSIYRVADLASKKQMALDLAQSDLKKG
jgi:4-hydroxybutyryl-CoA dehydratase/vinylacetyl-CoA-Delta-isomerase